MKQKKAQANKMDQTGKKHICNQKMKGVIEFTLSHSFHKMSGNKYGKYTLKG